MNSVISRPHHKGLDKGVLIEAYYAAQFIGWLRARVCACAVARARYAARLPLARIGKLPLWAPQIASGPRQLELDQDFVANRNKAP